MREARREREGTQGKNEERGGIGKGERGAEEEGKRRE